MVSDGDYVETHCYVVILIGVFKRQGSNGFQHARGEFFLIEDLIQEPLPNGEHCPSPFSYCIIISSQSADLGTLKEAHPSINFTTSRRQVY